MFRTENLHNKRKRPDLLLTHSLKDGILQMMCPLAWRQVHYGSHFPILCFENWFGVIITPPITPNNNFWRVNRRNSQEKNTLCCLVPPRKEYTVYYTNKLSGNWLASFFTSVTLENSWGSNYHRPQNRYMPDKNCLGKLILAYITEGAPKKMFGEINLGIGPWPIQNARRIKRQILAMYWEDWVCYGNP